MSDTKMLRLILDGQVSIRGDIKGLEKKMNDGFEKVSDRIDKIGLRLASLEDDASTIEGFDSLEKRVKKLEKQTASV